MSVVLQKFISDSGFCSRRKAEELIRLGKVKVNNRLAELGMRADENDEVVVFGKKVISRSSGNIYIALNKPAGYTCTNRTFKNEKNIFSLVDVKDRLFVVGRLDKDSTGLVILTNDGQWAEKVSHPRYQHEKEYIVKIKSDKKLSENQVRTLIDILQKGVQLDDGSLARTRVAKYIGQNTFELILTQGKKRQIRRTFAALGYNIFSLQRVRIGDICLDDLPEGSWKSIKVK